MPVTEPVTMLTDYALAALGLMFGHRLFHSESARDNLSVKLWSIAFVATAGASICGGTFHGFQMQLSASAQEALWKATVYCLGLMSLLMLTGAMTASVSRRPRRWLMALAVLQFAIYGVWMISHDDFRFVIYDYAPAMLGVLALQSWAAYRHRAESAKWIIAGVLVSLAGAAVQQTGFRQGRNFNHNDLYHAIQMIALYLFYRGGRLLNDQR